MNDSIDRQFAQITERGLDQLRERIGVHIENSLEPWCHEATRDNIRHYAHGIGDDNPLWCDPDYAATTKYGGIVAPPSFLFACDRIVSGYVGGLPGVHAMWAGSDFTWHKPIKRNTEFRILWPRGEMGALPDDARQDMLIESVQMDVEDLRVIQKEVHDLTIRIGTMESLYAQEPE